MKAETGNLSKRERREDAPIVFSHCSDSGLMSHPSSFSSPSLRRDEFRALQDIDLDPRRSETLDLIGRTV
jgi:hypothetical protein